MTNLTGLYQQIFLNMCSQSGTSIDSTALQSRMKFNRSQFMRFVQIVESSLKVHWKTSFVLGCFTCLALFANCVSGKVLQTESVDLQLTESLVTKWEKSTSKSIESTIRRGELIVMVRSQVIEGETIASNSLKLYNSDGVYVRSIAHSVGRYLFSESSPKREKPQEASTKDELLDIDGNGIFDLLVIDCQLRSINWFFLGDDYRVSPLSADLFQETREKGTDWLVNYLLENQMQHFVDPIPKNTNLDATFISQWPATRVLEKANDDGSRTEERTWFRGEFMQMRDRVTIRGDIVVQRCFDAFLPEIGHPICQWTLDSKGISKLSLVFEPGLTLYDVGADGQFDYVDAVIKDRVEYLLLFEGGEFRPLPDWLAETARTRDRSWFQETAIDWIIEGQIGPRILANPYQ